MELLASSIFINNDHIKKFWVGLMDGNGSIQVNHWRQKNLQYRLVIKLSNLESNVKMLILISNQLKGHVRISKDGKFVLWILDNKNHIINIIKIFDKYSKQLNLIQEKNIKFELPLNYFNSWLSGFIEAEGCFSIRQTKNSSFSISQNKDIYILNAIKTYFDASNVIRTPYKNKSFYSLEIYKKNILLKIINHCELYPLLGAKNDSLLNFIKYFE